MTLMVSREVILDSDLFALVVHLLDLKRHRISEDANLAIVIIRPVTFLSHPAPHTPPLLTQCEHQSLRGVDGVLKASLSTLSTPSWKAAMLRPRGVAR